MIVQNKEYSTCEQLWLTYLNRTYQKVLSERISDLSNLLQFLQTQPQDSRVDIIDSSGQIWATYNPSSRLLVGYNKSTLLHAPANDTLWVGEPFSHPPKFHFEKGPWVCENGVLRNAEQRLFVVCGLVPKSTIIEFMQWFPMAQKYLTMGASSRSMRNLL